ncbi:DUF3445 domain-containing protein [Simiduia litorea]|uniref:heme-dependent oxidative N-demethylase family protein n=1 Tax=Simiduia litorea TaxID=1435348 RepID=UPI0036F274F8
MSYYAFQDHSKLLSMGLHKLDVADWLIEDHLISEQVALKRALYDADAKRVYQALPESVPAQREMAQELSLYLVNKYPNLYRPSKSGLYCTFNDTELDCLEDENTLLRASWAVQEDLCLLESPNGEEYFLTATSLCAPSYWRLLEKIGKNLDVIHAPIPGYQDALGANVNRFFQKLKIGAPVWRGNWSVVTNARLYQPGDSEAIAVTEPENIARCCYLRGERQTLRRLPESNAIAFTIRVSIEPIAVIASDLPVLQSLYSALKSMSAEEKAYKSLHHLEPALSTWLLQRINSL